MSMQNKHQRITFSAPDKLRADLAEVATETGRQQAEMIREALDQYLEAKKKFLYYEKAVRLGIQKRTQELADGGQSA